MAPKRMLRVGALCALLALAQASAVAESDAIVRDAPTPAQTPDAEPGEPLDLVPHSLPETTTPANGLKQVQVPLPPQITRTTPAVQNAMTETPDAAVPSLSTSGKTPAPVTQAELEAPEPPKPSFAPRTASLPSFVLEPSKNPAIPSPTGSATAPTMQAPPGLHGADDEEEEGTTPPQGGSVETQTDVVEVACLKPELLELIRQTGNFFKQIPVITSGYRARGRAGSYHKRCMAADFIVPGISQQQLVSFLRHLPGAGGVGTYCHTKAVHLDIGEPRDWGYCGLRRTYFSMR